jgi:hypothetical protein
VLHAPSISFSRQVAVIHQETYSSQQRIYCEFRPGKATKLTLESVHVTLGSILYLIREITYHCRAVQAAALMCTDAMRTENTTFRTLSRTSMFFFTDSLVLLKAFLSLVQMCLQRPRQSSYHRNNETRSGKYCCHGRAIRYYTLRVYL